MVGWVGANEKDIILCKLNREKRHASSNGYSSGAINIWTILLHSTTRLSCRDELNLVQECFYKDFSTNLSTKVNICLFKLTLIFVNHMLTSSCILWSVKFGFLFSFSFQMYASTHIFPLFLAIFNWFFYNMHEIVSYYLQVSITGKLI